MAFVSQFNFSVASPRLSKLISCKITAATKTFQVFCDKSLQKTMQAQTDAQTVFSDSTRKISRAQKLGIMCDATAKQI